MTQRGFVASGSLPPATIATLAREGERLGYTTFWITVLAGRADPVELLLAAAEATDRIELGLGLVPLSAYGAAELAARLRAAGAPAARTVVALGVGTRHDGAVRLWTREARAFRAAAPALRLAVGSYGAGVLRAGGAIADAVLVNWMTQERIRWALARADEGARRAGRPAPRPAYAYVNSAVGEDAGAAIDRELARFAAYPYHRRHQREMAARTRVGAAVGRADEVDAALAPFALDAVPVVNPVGELDLDGRLRVLETFAPSAGGDAEQR